jgi:hypothetical protein
VREVTQDAFAPPSAVIGVHVLDGAAGHDADPLLGGIDAEEPAGAPILGDGIVGRERVTGPPDPAAPTRIEDRAFAEHQPAHGGMNAVGPHHQIVAARLAVARARQHLAAMLLDGCNADPHAHGWTTG